MPDSTITPVVPMMPGVAWTWQTPVISINYLFVNAGQSVLLVNNASAGSIDVTITRFGSDDGEARTARTVAVGAGVIKAIGIFPPAVYNTKSGADTGKAVFTFSAVTTVTYALFALSG